MTIIILNPLLEVEVARSAEVKAACKTQADKGAAFAQGIAPVATGAYQASIHAESTADGAQIIAGGGTVDYAIELEVGSIHNPPFHVLLKAGEAMGHL